MGEEWAFSRYSSTNELWAEGNRIAKDVLLLDDHQVYSGAPRSLRDRLAPYCCYATVILYGPLVEGVISGITTQYNQISVLKAKVPAEILWSISPMKSGGEGSGAIIRVAGKETEVVKKWLGQALGGLEETIGIDVYRRAFSAV
jgi:urease accessory protein